MISITCKFNSYVCCVVMNCEEYSAVLNLHVMEIIQKFKRIWHLLSPSRNAMCFQGQVYLSRSRHDVQH